jgi:hypothetical protein
VVAKAGELIDVKLKAALDELRRRTEGDVIKAQVVEEKRKAETIAAELEAAQAKVTQAESDKRNLRLVLAGAGALGIGMVLLLIVRGRRPRTMALAPAGLVNGQLPPSQAALASPAVRASVVAEMTRWLKQHFAQRLITSNAAIAETQRLAALQVAELERRLEEMSGPLQNRLQAYEQRISELEQQLAAQGAENRELLKATIKMARERLEAQRSQSALAVN